MEAVRLKPGDFIDRFNQYSHFVLKDGYLYDGENITAVNSSLGVLDKNETGLMIIGNPGSGKTLLFEMAQKIIHPIDHKKFVKVNVLDVVLDFNNKNVGHGVFQKWKYKNVFFDDLGTESMGYLFGEKVEVFEKFIQMRYDLFRAKKLKTHFTSNLGKDKLTERYGMRCISRLTEMCTVVMLGEREGYKDRRQYRNFIGLPPVYHEKTKSMEDIEWEHRYRAMKKEAQDNPVKSNYEGLGSRIRKALGT